MTAADNSVVIVTGRAQGIGQATARLLLGRGYRVVIADNDPDACDECRTRYQGQAIDVIPTDTADEQAVGELVATTLSRHGRVGRPEDVASMVAYLLSDEAGFITGQNFIVDGGMTRKMIYVD